MSNAVLHSLSVVIHSPSAISMLASGATLKKDTPVLVSFIQQPQSSKYQISAINFHHRLLFEINIKRDIMRFITAITSVAIVLDSCSAFAPSAVRLTKTKVSTSLRMADGSDEPIMNKYSR